MKTLIVDDEAISRTILTDIMAPLGKVVATGKGKAAIDLYRGALEDSAPFDVMILDISMPDLDGREVLRTIRTLQRSRKVPRTTRIVVASARMNRSVIQECIDLGCHDYITKPVSQTRLLKRLHNLGLEFRDTDNPTETTIHPKVVATIIKKLYKGNIHLPVLPRIVREIQDVLAAEEPSIDALVPVIEKDTVISGKLVGVANSPLYRGVDAVTDLRAAIVRLGIEATHAAVSTITSKLLFDSDNTSLKEILEKHWLHSFATACCGKLIAEKVQLKNADTVFLMGITYDLGNVLLMKAIADLSPDTSFEDIALLKAIHEIHTTFGATLLKKWKFPDTFIRLAELHHWNSFPPRTEKEILVIRLADFLAGTIGFGFPGFEITSQVDDKEGAADKGIAKILSFLGQPPDMLIDMQKDAREVVEASSQAF
jgi:HD-like signal output (HDOD) protein